MYPCDYTPQTSAGVGHVDELGNPTMASDRLHGCGSASDFHRTSPKTSSYSIIERTSKALRTYLNG